MKRIFLFLFLLLSICDHALAEYYSANTTFDYPGSKVYAGEFAKVNDSKFITYMHGAEGKGVYAVHRKSGAAELVMSDNTNFKAYEVWDSYFHSLDNGALIDVYGKLYLTDGTRAGTRFIADFGATNTGGSLGYDFSRITQVTQAGRFVYIYQTQIHYRVGESNDQEAPALWRIDLDTATRTKLQSDESYLFNTTIIDQNDQEGSVIIFSDQGGEGVGLWRASPENNNLTPLALFEGGEGRGLNVRSQWFVRTHAGLFFCRAENVDGYSQYSVWRLSNSNTLTRVAENCGDFGLAAVSKDKKDLFYTLEVNERAELWQNSGTTSSNRLVKRLPQSDATFTDLCVAGDILVAVIAFKDSYEDYQQGVYLFGENGSEQYIQNSYAHCVADKVVLGDALTYPHGIESVIDPKTNERLNVKGIDASERVLAYQTFSDDVLWLLRRTVNESGQYENRYRDRLIHLQLKDVTYLPGILNLLNDDEHDRKDQ